MRCAALNCGAQHLALQRDFPPRVLFTMPCRSQKSASHDYLQLFSCAAARKEAHRRAAATRRPPAETGLPRVCAPCRSLAPRDHCAPCVSPPGRMPPSDVHHPRGVRPAGGCPHPIAPSLRPQTCAVSARSSGMPPGVQRRVAPDGVTDGRQPSRLACTGHALSNGGGFHIPGGSTA